MRGSIFAAQRFEPRPSMGPRWLGQAPPPPPEELIDVDRELADAVKVAIITLIQNPGKPEIYTHEACWRDLRSRRASQVTLLQTKITDFLNTSEKSIKVNAAEWALMDDVIACVEELSADIEAKTQSTISTLGGVVGVIGGLVAIIAALS